MYHYWAGRCLAQKQKINFHNWIKILNRSFSIAKDNNLPKISRLLLPKVLKNCLGKFQSIQAGRHTFNFCRNFSTSLTNYSNRGSNQNLERIKNYIFFGLILLAVLFVFYMNLTMEKTQDKVFLGSAKNDK